MKKSLPETVIGNRDSSQWRRNSRNMSARGLETVLIGNIGNCVHKSIRSRVGVGSLHHLGFQLSTRVLKEALLVSTNSVGCFVTGGGRGVGFQNIVIN